MEEDVDRLKLCPVCGQRPKYVLKSLMSEMYDDQSRVECTNLDCPVRPRTKYFPHFKHWDNEWGYVALGWKGALFGAWDRVVYAIERVSAKKDAGTGG